ncbi:hypothetical protein HGB07_08570 [Candidatus Roizmanbacteria bacterium]|nr:hypothetical protein [Candidatus Roizmanbacteria bacterium]
MYNKILYQVIELKRQITNKQGDDETQHDLEDRMRLLLVEAVEQDYEMETLKQIAQIIRQVELMDFSRWCA